MNIQMALLALESAGIDGKGARAARELLARDPWPAEIELPAHGDTFVDPAEPLGALAEDFAQGRVTAADLPGQMADIALMRVGVPLWHQLRALVGSTHEIRAQRLLADDWPGIQKEITSRGAAAWKQRAEAEKELAAAKQRLGRPDYQELSRAEAVRASGGAVEAWDGHAQASRRLRVLHALRHQLADHGGLGERPREEWYADAGSYVPRTGRRLVPLNN